MNATTEVITQPQAGPPVIYVHSLAEALEMASVLSHITAEPEAEIAAKVLAGQELGIPPAAAVRGIYVLTQRDGSGNVKTRTVMLSSLAMSALVRKSGKCGGMSVKIEDGKNPPSTGRAVFWGKRSDTGEEITETFSMNDAGKASLIKGKGMPWDQYPKDMLRNRVLGRGVKALWPEVTMGLEVGSSERDYMVATAVVGEDKPEIFDAETGEKEPAEAKAQAPAQAAPAAKGKVKAKEPAKKAVEKAMGDTPPAAAGEEVSWDENSQPAQAESVNQEDFK